jgi:hypothetical protein
LVGGPTSTFRSPTERHPLEDSPRRPERATVAAYDRWMPEDPEPGEVDRPFSPSMLVPIVRVNVSSPGYRLWLDALFARELARKTASRWERGAYVRWTVISACTVMEAVIDESLDLTIIAEGKAFKEAVDEALGFRCVEADWSGGVWQRVTALRKLRQDFVHLERGITQAGLFAPLEQAEKAIIDAREGVRVACGSIRRDPPHWIGDDTHS